jgi:hypothetical protein
MSAAAESKAVRAIAERLAEIPPDSPRHEVLQVARRFKTSWVELGNKLLEVRRRKMFEEWGYDSFDAYCQEEIRIKPRTAAKLTASYSFLKESEPAVLKRDGIANPIPDPEAVEVLRRAHEESKVPEAEYRRIRDLAFEDAPANLLRRELKPLVPAKEAGPKELFKRLVGQAERLANTLASVQGVPRVIVDRALALVDDLRALVG